MTRVPTLRTILRWLLIFVVLLILLMLGPLSAYLFADLDMDTHWSQATWKSAGLAPDPLDTEEAVVQVYAARAYNWRGAFGSHSWISIKPRDTDHYTVIQLIGWRLRSSSSAISISEGDMPDAYWYNAEPELLADHRGEIAEKIIPAIETAVMSYPYYNQYSVWPGPNSNTFIAWIARAVPEMRLDLPATAIGKDYLPNSDFTASMPSGTGGQFSLNGMLGVGLALEEGIEFNLMGLNFGIDFNDLALRVPGWGHLPRHN